MTAAGAGLRTGSSAIGRAPGNLFESSNGGSGHLRLGRQTNLAERLTKLKRCTSPIAHVDQPVEDPQELLGQIHSDGRITTREVLHQFRDARRNIGSMPTL
jgi:hypothetical protein